MVINRNLLENIVKIANELDFVGLSEEANALDSVLFSMSGGRPAIIKVPDIRQYNEYSCGSACLLALLSHWGVYDGNEKQLAKKLGTNSKDGTDPHSMAEVARSLGLVANVKYDCDFNDLREAIQSRNPPIVNFQAWSKKKEVDWSNNWADGHYAICVGIDDKRIYFRDPAIYNKVGYLSLKEFKERWHDSGDNGERAYAMAIFISGSIPDEDDELMRIE